MSKLKIRISFFIATAIISFVLNIIAFFVFGNPETSIGNLRGGNELFFSANLSLFFNMLASILMVISGLGFINIKDNKKITYRISNYTLIISNFINAVFLTFFILLSRMYKNNFYYTHLKLIHSFSIIYLILNCVSILSFNLLMLEVGNIKKNNFFKIPLLFTTFFISEITFTIFSLIFKCNYSFDRLIMINDYTSLPHNYQKIEGYYLNSFSLGHLKRLFDMVYECDVFNSFFVQKVSCITAICIIFDYLLIILYNVTMLFIYFINTLDIIHDNSPMNL